MADVRVRPASGETEIIIDEYRRRISEALENERSRLLELAEQESAESIARAQAQARLIIDESRKNGNEESARLILQAEQRAEQLIKETNRKVQEEAKDKARREVERIIARSKEDADRSVTRAQETARHEADEIIAGAKKQADQAAREARERAFKEARNEADEIISKAKLEAAQWMKDSRQKATEEAKKESLRIISKAEQIAGQITISAASTGIKQGREQVNQLLAGIREKLQSEAGQLVAETMHKVEAVIEKARIELEERAADAGENETAPEGKLAKVLEPEDADEMRPVTASSQDEEPGFADHPNEKGTVMADVIEGRLYQGLLNLEIIHPVDNAQLVNLRKHLLQVPGMQLVSTGGSVNKNITKTVYTVEVKSPLPLLRILKELPPVESVAAQKKQDIAIKLR